jgi:biopolymer transport protein ExbB
MNAVIDMVTRGGPVMIPIILLSVALYERCLHLLLMLGSARRKVARFDPVRVPLTEVRLWQYDLSARFQHQRIVITSLIAAAPLLGLLGTVSGMIQTFDSLASRVGARSIEGLASGISQALITTEVGLAVVIPAVLVLYYAHRQLQKGIQQLVVLEGRRTQLN